MQQEARELRRWAVGIVAVFTVAVFTVAVLIGYRYGITLWDWIKLLIVPTAIAGAGLWFNTQQREHEQRIADNRAQDDSLQAYLDGMSQLLTDREQPLYGAQQGDSLSTVARARTLTVLGRLDGSRKRSVLQFLYESGLIYKERTLLNEADLIERRHTIVGLEQAVLSSADLSGANLSGANLSGANLEEALLSGTTLIEADLSGAYLSGADLSGAKRVTNEQLSTARSLEGATMPDGQTLRGHKTPNGPTFEEWLNKDRERRKEDGENA